VATATQPNLLLPLQRLFGHADFREGQERIVGNALGGRDTLALLPTGSGKSLPYQLAAMLLPTPTLVLSPLIALMKDQVDKLPPAVAARSTLVNSSLDAGVAAERLERFANGDVKLLYAAPERLRQRRFVDALAAAGVGLVVVDEVHCVSMWGHDFRPDYLFIRRAVELLGEPTILGMTATATPRVESEIARALGRDFDVVRTSVVRPNLHHEVDRVESEEERKRRVLERLAASGGPSIVYARSRKKCEELSRLLRNHRIAAEHYHAGLEAAERTRVQEAFLQDEARVIVATTAFGMGIDKPDIRLVLLYNYPSSLEDYVQMVGRAGRDGRESACVLFAGDRDASALRRFARDDVPTVGSLRDLYRQLRSRAHDGRVELDPNELEADQDVRVAIGMLEQAELVRRDFDAGRRVVVEILTPPKAAAERMELMLARYEREALDRADGIVAYGDSWDCRQGLVARHFGESPQERCGTCDRCSRREIGVVAFTEPSRASEAAADVGSAVLAAVERLRWPLGETGLVAMLTGSVAAPPSARRSPDFGALSAATPSAVRRTVRALVDSGHLDRYESDDGFRLLRRTTLPPPEPKGEQPVDEALFERLRTWRRETARAEDVPAFVVFSDRALRAIAAERPRDREELARVHGVGQAKLERYGDRVLAVVAAA
jgi:ATP-dependent DNA helicase RecQ